MHRMDFSSALRENRELKAKLLCEDCGHTVDRHGPNGCEVERTRRESGYAEQTGPCSCKAVQR